MLFRSVRADAAVGKTADDDAAGDTRCRVAAQRKRRMALRDAPHRIAVRRGEAAQPTIHSAQHDDLRRDDGGRVQLMRQIDGGASVLIGNLQSVRLSYWNEWGGPVVGVSRITLIAVELLPAAGERVVVRDVSVRS